MNRPSLLLTQCLQNDFVQPIGRYDPVPNALHVGYAEALRLMGENPAEGPVARLMRWAYETGDDECRVVHVRDGHDDHDPAQHEHLARFGKHCLKNTDGARFAFHEPSTQKDVVVVDSPGLNDFFGTPLDAALSPWRDQPVRVGVVGVWTEAKVSYLVYELATRFPHWKIAVCSALCASSSRQHHFQALDNMDRLLGVQVIDSVGDFIAFLGGASEDLPLIGLRDKQPEIVAEGLEMGPTDRELARYLFRDCKKVSFKGLTGGYSGNVVAAAKSIDLHGHEQVPHVVKIGARASMGKERASFERVQQVLGNNAPLISDFADFGDRGAIKYRYASMGGASATFQKQWMQGLPMDEVQRVLDAVFVEQLGRFYQAAQHESGDLLEHYGFSSRYAQSVGRTADAIEPGGGQALVDFYTRLDTTPRRARDAFHQAWVHGDLNGANIILDARKNVWLIDFFHTRSAHVLMDLIKLENDLLFIWTALPDDDALARAKTVIDRLLDVDDLGAPLPVAFEDDPLFARTWATIRILRGYAADLVRSDRDPFQWHVAALRYAVHTLTFDECDARQKRLALYTAQGLAAVVTRELSRSARLRIDWLPDDLTAPGRIGMTLLPGRRDMGRDIGDDLEVCRAQGVTHVVSLVPDDELARYGVADLPRQVKARGLELLRLSIVDQAVCSLDDVRDVNRFVDDATKGGGKVMVHCVGGLGRSGMIVASYLAARGMSADEAIGVVRRTRSPRAVETEAQERLVQQVAQERA